MSTHNVPTPPPAPTDPDRVAHVCPGYRNTGCIAADCDRRAPKYDAEARAAREANR